MFCYKNGQLVHTDSPTEALHNNFLTLALSNSYGHSPKLAGKLWELLGVHDLPTNKNEAMLRIRAALNALGLPDSQINVLYDALPTGWQMYIDVTHNT